MMRHVGWWLRVRVKRWLARRTLIIEFCEVCGREQPVVWHADDSLWLAVVGRSGGVLCPECFDRRARVLMPNRIVMWTAKLDV